MIVQTKTPFIKLLIQHPCFCDAYFLQQIMMYGRMWDKNGLKAAAAADKVDEVFLFM